MACDLESLNHSGVLRRKADMWSQIEIRDVTKSGNTKEQHRRCFEMHDMLLELSNVGRVIDHILLGVPTWVADLQKVVGEGIIPLKMCL
jgi:hypothetical protein